MDNPQNETNFNGMAIIPKAGELSTLAQLSHLAKEFAKNARAKNTEKSYASDWRDFDSWCKSKGLNSLPAAPYSVACYLSDRATNAFIDPKGKLQNPLKTASLSRRLSSISQAHRMVGMPFDRKHPAIQETWKGIKNTLGISQGRKEPILIEDLRGMINALNEENKLINLRDKALLLIGFAGAFRRSELVNIDFEDLKLVRDGFVIKIKRSKTDQEEKGMDVAIPYGSHPDTCPVRALKDWFSLSGITSGYIFRSINRHGNISQTGLSARSVARIIKRNHFLKQNAIKYSGHSLRSGFVTTAAIAGVQEYAIMKQTGHKRSDTLKKYIRSRELWKDNPASKIGL
ncbi:MULTISPECIES: site-specific integrase [Parachlamydia]|uniref:site-specific integrase n=1 Tax=Parachlamydia TaxID=83551 RepID=UPI0024E23263|nr:site-specific integrase [Parachlamydia acanthamoebae]